MIDPFVDIDWLREHRDEVVVADSRWYPDGRSGPDAYAAGHVPGAVFVDVDSTLSAHGDPALGGRHPLPDPEDFAASMTALGIGDGDTVVAYDDAGGVIAARFVWMLRTIGHAAALLDGGLAAWDVELERGEPSGASARASARPAVDFTSATSAAVDLRSGSRTEGRPRDEERTEGRPRTGERTEGRPRDEERTEGRPRDEERTEGRPRTEERTEGRPRRADAPGPSTVFTARPWPAERLATIDEAAALAASGGTVIDARPAERFAGAPDDLDPRAGHIPGARSVPCRANVDASGRLLPAEELRERFAVEDASEVVSYCGSGVTACHNLLAMEAAGLGVGRLFPGSWSQWSRDPDRPVQTGEV